MKQKKVKQNILTTIVATIKRNPVEYVLLVLILGFAAFFRLFRLDALLGFWYDQGRDALVIWDLIHYKRFFLIGPVTGIEGIFLGPFYYYLLVPFYLLGKGSPVTAAAGLSWLTVGAIFLIYFLAKSIYNEKIGLLAAFIYAFSYGLVTFARWLANPNPLPFFTMLLILCFWFFIKEGKKFFLPLAGFLLGLCLQLEAASAIFFLPSVAVILFWQRKKLNLKLLAAMVFAFVITLIPQLYFNFRHDGILVSAFNKFLIADKSFSLSLVKVAELRFKTYYDVFTGKLIPLSGWPKLAILALFSAGLVFSWKKIANEGGKLLLIWLGLPLIGYLFYHGNHGYVWDYYFTGVIPAFVILFSAGLFFLWQKWLVGKIVVMLFILFFSYSNLVQLRNYFNAGIGITLRSQKRAIDWIYEDVGAENFNIDVYVPPQIYFSYSYLFRWYGPQKYGREPNANLVKNLYTLEEPDGEHPQFLKAWLARQDTIGKIKYDYSWGDITVQKRERIKYD